MTMHKKPKWENDVNFNNMKAPLKNMLEALKTIRKEYTNKQKEYIRLQKGSNGNTTV